MQLPYKQKLLTSSWLFRATKQHQAAHDQIEGETDTILMRLKVNYSNTEGLKLTDCKFSYEDSHTNSIITRSPTPANLTIKCR